MDDITALNRVSYTSLDFTTVEDDLRARIQVKFAADFNDFSLSGLGIMLLDVISFGLDTLSFYLDRRATENYLATARTRAALARITRQLGYKMGAATAASVDLNVALQRVYTFDVTIPKGFQFQSSTGLVYESSQDIIFPAGWTVGVTQTVSCYQGESVSETFTSTGAPNQIFRLTALPDQTFVVQNSVRVTVAGSAFLEEDFLLVSTQDQFEVGYNDDPPVVRFGDGVAGNIPTTGASIVVRYVASKGKNGRVTNGSVTVGLSPLVVAFTNIPLTITQPQPSSGGDLPEDMEHARAMAGKVFKARQVACTSEDYQALAGSFADPLSGRVAVAQAISVRSSTVDAEYLNYLMTIEAALIDLQTNVPADVLALTTDATSIGVSLAAVHAITDVAPATPGTMTLQLDTIESRALAVQASQAAATLAAATAGTNASSALASATAASGSVNGVASLVAPDNLTTATKNTIMSQLAAAIGASTRVATDIGVVSSSLASITTDTNALLTAKRACWDSLPLGTSLLAVADANVAASILIVGDPATITGMFVPLADIASHYAMDISTSTSIIPFTLDAIGQYLTKILSADCKSNVVSVPILALDDQGFYTSPTLSLISSLQTFLDARKEVTQIVRVVKGDYALIYPVIGIYCGYRGVTESVYRATVNAVVDAILRGRAFGAPLYESDLVTPISQIPGTVYCSVNLNGYRKQLKTAAIQTDKVVHENLIILTSEVITKGDPADVAPVLELFSA